MTLRRKPFALLVATFLAACGRTDSGAMGTAPPAPPPAAAGLSPPLGGPTPAGPQAPAPGSTVAPVTGEAPSGPARVGAPAPDFTLKDTEGAETTLSAHTKAGKIIVLEWFNADCPFVKRHHGELKTMAALAAAYREKGVVWLGINSSSRGKQGYGVDRNRRARRDYSISYPILMDEPGTVARAYGAKTTPHMYVIDKTGILAYAGAIDDNPAGSGAAGVNYVRQALEEVLADRTVSVAHTKAYGCSVKYAGK